MTGIASGDEITNYGRVIGRATQNIEPGEHVHVHNVGMAKFNRSQVFGAKAQETEFIPQPQRATFQGYRRTDGKVGTRNYVGIVTSVNCSGSAAKNLAREAERSGRYTNSLVLTGSFLSCIGPDVASGRMTKPSESCKARSGAMQPT